METPDGGRKAQIVYLSHGGGPLPLLGDPSHDKMVAFMGELGRRLRRPDAIVMVSAHWETAVTTVQGAASPDLLYDYYGFPDEAYHLTYRSPGDPALASHLVEVLGERGLPCRVDPERGSDHGAFIPLLLMYPDGDVPSVQVSLFGDLDPRAHLGLGEALRPLLAENLLVIGSGSSFHNLRAFDPWSPGAPDARNDTFQDWLIEACASDLTQDERERRLVDWEAAPNARYVHPREDHLLPLHVCAGMAQRPGEVVFDAGVAGKRCVAFLWE